MVYVAGLITACWGLSVLAFLRFLISRERGFARERMAFEAERRDLLNRVMHMANRTWEGPRVEEDTTEYGDPYDGFVFPDEIVGATN